MTNKIVIILITCIMLFSGGLLFASDDDVAATVNGTPIYLSNVERELNILYRQAYSQGIFLEDGQIDDLRDTALNNLIDREILYQDAVASGYTVDDTAVDQYINALTANYGGSEQLEAQLSAQGLDLETLKIDTGRYQIINTFVAENIAPEVQITEQESREYYDSNASYFVQDEYIKASHILIQTPEDADEAEMNAALEKIKTIRERIMAGEDFTDMAREYSDCPSSAQGGDLGEFGHGQMVPPFDRAAFALEVGEVSEPVQTQFGFHLIKLFEKHDDEVIPYEDAEQQIIDYLGNQEIQSKLISYVEELKENGNIVYN